MQDTLINKRSFLFARALFRKLRNAPKQLSLTPARSAGTRRISPSVFNYVISGYYAISCFWSNCITPLVSKSNMYSIENFNSKNSGSVQWDSWIKGVKTRPQCFSQLPFLVGDEKGGGNSITTTFFRSLKVSQTFCFMELVTAQKTSQGRPSFKKLQNFMVVVTVL